MCVQCIKAISEIHPLFWYKQREGMFAVPYEWKKVQ